MEDQGKFFNVIIERTNQRLNSLQAQVIVLESQLQIANEERDAYKKYAESLSPQSISASELALFQEQHRILLQENKTYTDQLAVYKEQIVTDPNLNNKMKQAQEQNETLSMEVRRLQRLVKE